MLDTGTQYDGLKFQAEAIRTLALIVGTPFGLFIIESIFTGIKWEWFLLFKLFSAAASAYGCDFLLGLSYNVMKLRDWQLERLRRTKQ